MTTNASGLSQRPGTPPGRPVAGEELEAENLPARVLAFLMRPELNPFWWGLVLLLAILIAITLGWWIYRERVRRRSQPAFASRYARPA